MDTTARADRATIGELAAEFGLTLRAIRHYEDEGLLTPRRHGSQRLYDRRDRVRLGLICRGKRLGFSLAEIREFLALYDLPDRQEGQMRFLRHRVQDRIDALERQRQDIQDTLAELHAIAAQVAGHFGAAAAEESRS